MDGLPIALIEPHILVALQEDLGVGGDVTTLSVVPSDAHSYAMIVARQAGHVAGLEIAERVFRLLDPEFEFTPVISDGSAVIAGAPLAELKGTARAILTGERTALNYLTHLSGIATATSRFVSAIEGTKSRIVCTRKTTPTLRALEKYAVRMGGGPNHRFALDQAVLIKDNHIAFAGSVSAAVSKVRSRVGHTMFVELEVDTLEQLREALTLPINAVLLDNMTLPELSEAVKLVDGKLTTEASGGVTLERVRAIAETGVDLISVGWITASSPSLDIALDWRS